MHHVYSPINDWNCPRPNPHNAHGKKDIKKERRALDEDLCLTALLLPAALLRFAYTHRASFLYTPNSRGVRVFMRRVPHAKLRFYLPHMFYLRWRVTRRSCSVTMEHKVGNPIYTYLNSLAVACAASG